MELHAMYSTVVFPLIVVVWSDTELIEEAEEQSVTYEVPSTQGISMDDSLV